MLTKTLILGLITSLLAHPTLKILKFEFVQLKLL